MFHREHERVQKFFKDGSSRTQQAFKDQCDVNQIMSRFEKQGVVDHANTYRGLYGDFCELGDFHTLCNQVVRAEEMFMQIPAAIRAKFDNDPGKFLEFAQDPANAEKMVEMGLLRQDDAPPPRIAPEAPEAPEGDPEPPAAA